MKKEKGLLERLIEYGNSDMYPFHMPGHKRRTEAVYAKGFPNPYGVDITEIDGFDNLHHPEGILKQSMEWAADLYGADRTYYLVNGSSCGILSAISGTVNNSDTILMSRNSHKSAYNGVFLNHLRTMYIYPQFLKDYCVQGGLLPDKIEDMLKTYVEITAVFVVSPTYDGIVSDIKKIANICHKHKIPLVVDEAHGAHFRYGEDLPVSALELGADVVIQSVHKTLPSLTQTALLHVKEGYVNVEKIERYLSIYQSSSPSYLLMAGIENCLRYMEGEGRRRMAHLTVSVLKLRKELEKLNHLQVLGRDMIGKAGIYDLDITKLIVSTAKTSMTGTELHGKLRTKYHLELEMCTDSYVTAILSVMDTEEGLMRLRDALFEIDGELENAQKQSLRSNPARQLDDSGNTDAWLASVAVPKVQMSIYDAVNGKRKGVMLEESVGRISAEYIYIYPPGIPIVAPGEVLKQEMVQIIRRYQRMGLSVQGTKDGRVKIIEIVEDEK